MHSTSEVICTMRICVFLCLATCYVCICETVDYVIKNTNYGKVQGFIKMSLPEKPVEIYYGVPFASPPIGDLRYQVSEIYLTASITVIIDTRNNYC